MMKKCVVFAFVLALACGQVASAQAPEASKAATSEQESPAQLKATIVKLQQALFDQQKESAKLLRMVAELQEMVADLRRSAFDAAVEKLPEDVKAAMAPTQKPVPPQTPPK